MHVPKIYIVDDDESVRDSARVLLESYDHVVEDYASARDFLEGYEGEGGCCLLLDLNMPDMDGFQLLEMLRDRGIDIPVIIVSAQDDKAVKEKARQAGAFAFFNKPVGDSLMKAIEQALSRN